MVLNIKGGENMGIQDKTRKELSKNKSVKIFKRILSGNEKRFPRGYWKKVENKMDARYCARYLIEVILELEHEDIYILSRKQFNTYMLGTMLKDVYENDVYELVQELYPNKYCEWRFKGKLSGYWTKETVKKAFNDIILVNNWNREYIINEYSYSFIRKIGLEYAVKKVYNNQIYKLLEEFYPQEIEIWELSNVKRGFWCKETAIKATKWMIENLGWERDEIKKYMSKKVFIDNGLEGMLKVVYNNSTYMAIADAYPNEFERFEVAVSKGYWTEETCAEAIRCVIENKLNFSEKDVREKLSKNHFREYKITYPIQKLYEGDFYNAIDAAYPGVYKRYELKGFNFREKRENSLVEYIKNYE